MSLKMWMLMHIKRIPINPHSNTDPNRQPSLKRSTDDFKLLKNVQQMFTKQQAELEII
jgi:hypothetical protein